jgi:TolB-like protein/DNA-binding winged helix-turn-helix (wHTH) protein
VNETPGPNGGKRIVRFGVFEVDVAGGALFRQGLKVKLQEQPFQVLVALIERPRDIVTREELCARLWPDSQVDFDRGLNKAINRLRDTLGDNADSPRFIETVPQRGYRFLMPVEDSDALVAPTPPQPDIAVPPRGGSRRRLLAMAGGLAGVSVGAFLYRRLEPPRPPRIESLAVLPLKNHSGDAAQEYFSDGMTEELIGEIGRTVSESVRVISRTSVMLYKRSVQKSLREIAGELHADVILEGSVTQLGRKVRINVGLVRTHDDRLLWSGVYESELADIRAVQSDVARNVAREIRSNPASTPKQGTPARRVNPEAYTAFLKGNYLLHQGIRGILSSIDSFTESTRLDPLHAAAHAGLAEALVYSGIYGLRSSEEAFPQARAAAMSALTIDEASAPAHNALADVKKGYEWDLAGAEGEYRKALRLDPNHLLTYLWYGDCLSRMNRHEEALAQTSRILALDPVSPISYTGSSMLYCRARRYDDAIRLSHQAVELAPWFVNARWWQGLAYAGKHDFSKSIECFTKAVEMDPGPVFRALLGHVRGLAGDKTAALRLVEELTLMAKQRFVSPMDFAIVHAGLGDPNSTFHWLEQAYRTRAARIHEVSWMYFDRFRADARYSDLVRRVGLPA